MALITSNCVPSRTGLLELRGVHHCLSLAFHCLSTAFRCLSLSLVTVYCLPFLGLSLSFHCLHFTDLSTALQVDSEGGGGGAGTPLNRRPVNCLSLPSPGPFPVLSPPLTAVLLCRCLRLIGSGSRPARWRRQAVVRPAQLLRPTSLITREGGVGAVGAAVCVSSVIV